ncbi:response regulator [Phaeobacter sp. CAU 1743]|uniref:response regulator n=1 Tax=Phaeobacter sp. CAU 1743 TaxID=3140367 RepID=UPI0023B7053A
MTLQHQNNKAEGLTILIVDDDKAVLEELQSILQLQGWNPITADSVDMALEVLDWYDNVDVVLTDAHFKEFSGDRSNGFQLISRASARFSDRAIGFVVMSEDPFDLKPTLQTDAADFLPKPINSEDLVDAVRGASKVASRVVNVAPVAENGEHLLKRVQRIAIEARAANLRVIRCAANK